MIYRLGIRHDLYSMFLPKYFGDINKNKMENIQDFVAKEKSSMMDSPTFLRKHLPKIRKDLNVLSEEPNQYVMLS